MNATEDTGPRCSDGEDNDADGFSDCSDQNCLRLEVCRGGDAGSVVDSGVDARSESDAGEVGEECNGIDDDGDGETDEESRGAGAPCVTGLQGSCAEGIRACLKGALLCEPLSRPQTESCADMDEDNDCDGATDDVEDVGADCDTGLGGLCGPGVLACAAGALDCVAQVSESEGSCPNGVDEDCNGRPDDGAVPSPETCGNMGQDDDCDGLIDNIVGTGADCTTDLPPPCADGMFVCDGKELVCGGFYLPADERCGNGFDDDCDEERDEADCLHPNLHRSGYGQEWIDDVVARTYSYDRARETCTRYVQAQGAFDSCDGECRCEDGRGVSDCVRNLARGNGEEQHYWFFNGPMVGITTPEPDLCIPESGRPWD